MTNAHKAQCATVKANAMRHVATLKTAPHRVVVRMINAWVVKDVMSKTARHLAVATTICAFEINNPSFANNMLTANALSSVFNSTAKGPVFRGAMKATKPSSAPATVATTASVIC